MRRGLISWSRAELPEAVLDGRVAAAQSAMARDGLDALVVHTIPARTSGVSYFTGFVPYWNEGLLAIPREGRPALVSALSNRVRDWIERNAHVERVLNNPRIGAEAGRFIAERTPRARIAVADLPRLPVTVTEALGSEGHTLVDGSALLAGLRAVAAPSEIALAARAATIARIALADIPSGASDAAATVACVDGTARRLGAEEVYPAIAADLSTSLRFSRLEGTRPLGNLAAVRVSLSYKGAWVRLTRVLATEPRHAALADAASVQLAAAITSLPSTAALAQHACWLVEACRTTTPLEAIAGAIMPSSGQPCAGSLVNVQANIAMDGVTLPLAAPALIGAAGQPSSLLAIPFC